MTSFSLNECRCDVTPIATTEKRVYKHDIWFISRMEDSDCVVIAIGEHAGGRMLVGRDTGIIFAGSTTSSQEIAHKKIFDEAR